MDHNSTTDTLTLADLAAQAFILIIIYLDFKVISDMESHIIFIFAFLTIASFAKT